METIDLKTIQGDKDCRPEVKHVYAKLKVYAESPARQKWLKNRESNNKLVGDNELWTEKEKEEMSKAGMVPFVANHCVKGVQGAAAIATDSKPGIQVFPKGSGDLYLAELLKRAVDHVFDKNKGEDVLYSTVEESKTGGLGWIEVNWDTTKGLFGKCTISDANPEDIYFSAERRKKDFSDTDIIKAKRRTRTYIKNHYPNLSDDDLSFKMESPDGDSGKSTGVTGKDNYSEDDSTPDADGTEKEKKDIWEIEASMLSTQKQGIVTAGEKVFRLEMPEAKGNRSPSDLAKEGLSKKYGDNVNIREIVVEVREHLVIVGKKLISKKINPFGTDGDGDPILRFHPLACWRGLKGYPTCPTTFARPINQESSKRRIQAIYAASQNNNSPIVEPDGMVKWTGNPGSPASRAKVDPKAPFNVTRIPSGGAEVVKYMELEAVAKEEINDMYDAPDVMRGKIPKGDPSGRVVLALQDTAGTMSKPFMRTFESTTESMGKSILAIIFKHWQRDMWERLIEEEELYTFIPEKMQSEDLPDPKKPEGEKLQKQINRNWMDALDKVCPQDPQADKAVSMLDIDIKIAAGSSMPTNRMARRADAVDMVKAGIYDAQAALEYIDDPKAKEIAKRVKEAQEANALQKMGA